MDGSLIVAGLSVVVAGGTSIGAPIIAGRNQRQSDAARFEHERDVDRSTREREALHEAAEAMRALQGATARVMAASVQGSPDSDDSQARFKAQSDAAGVAGWHATRLLLLLGPNDETAKTYQESLDNYVAAGAACMVGAYGTEDVTDVIAENVVQGAAHYKDFLVRASAHMRP